MRKCFTVTVARSDEDIKKAEELLVKTGIYGGCELFYPYEVSEEEAARYAESVECFTKYDDFQVVLHLPYGSRNNIASYNNLEVVMKRLCDAIDFAGKYGAVGVTLHPGELDGSLSHEDALALSIANTQKLCDYAKKWGITIMVENMIGERELCLTIEEMQKVQTLVNRDNLGITLDCGHYHAGHQTKELPKDLVKYVYTFKDKIKHLHLHDNSGATDEHKQLGLGTINFRDYFKALEDCNFNGTYGSEVLFKDYAELLTTAEKIDIFAGKKC